ncbi:hypothetical protein DFP72DRAFT_481743 [Ephemerocybe angulata]|uniref:Uncharacterized protein n=1 Tax=Ephemerocybe angulata TaxID=980116 RepID=A0A8H6MGH5_9AGAR|nr:hypothetical protein DFP72DRAFT_481743 [Tulosesus angulatus]
MQASLPQEIYDRITDNAERSSVKNLSLASKEHFLYQAQSHLFRELYIEPNVSDDMSASKILRGNPSLFKHVRFLSLQADWDGMPGDHGNGGDILGIIADHLDNLQVLWIEVPEFRCDWDNIKASYQAAICKLLTQAPIRRIVFTDISDIPPQLFRPAVNLERLELTGSTSIASLSNQILLSVDVDHDGERPLFPRGLRHLRHDGGGIEGVVPLLTYGTAHAALGSPYRNLRILQLDIATKLMHTNAWSLIAAVAAETNCLEILTIRYRSTFSRLRTGPPRKSMDQLMIDGQAAIPTFPSLRYLSLHFELITYYQEMFTPPSSALHHIPRIPCFMLKHHPQPSLEVLKLTCCAGPPTTSSQELARTIALPVPLLDREDGGWDQLDSVLSNHALFPKLQAMRILFSVRGIGLDSRNVPAEDYPIFDKARAVNAEVLAALPMSRSRYPLFDTGCEDTLAQFQALDDVFLAGEDLTANH